MTLAPVPRRATAEDTLVRRAALRLGLHTAAFVAAAVLLVVGAATVVLVHVTERGATDLLDATIAVADDVEDPPLDIWLVVRNAKGREATAGLPAGADDPAELDAVAAGAPAGDAVRHVGGVDYRVMTARRRDGATIQAVLDLSALQRSRATVLEVMVLTGIVGLAVAAAAGAWLGRRALRPLTSAFALQRRFVADAGHELRTPLTLLDTRAQLLRRRLRRVSDGGPLPPAWRELAESGSSPATGVADLALRDIEGVVADSARLTDILEDLLLAADPLAQRPNVPFDLVRLCRDAVQASSVDADARGVDLTGPSGEDPPAEVRGSTAALHRALTALIDNALRHADHAVSVTVTTRRGEAVVDVTDDGPGVDPEVAPRVFTRFAAGAQDGRAGRRRFGLGLAIVSEIAAAHGGRVELLHRGRAATPDDAGRTVLRVALPLSHAGLQEFSEIEDQ
jgi:signal transduction histidine kinase